MQVKTIIRIIAALAIAVGCFLLYQHLGRGVLILNVSPKHATISVDGKDVNGGAKREVRLPYGPHEIIITAPGYKKVATNIDLGWRESQTKYYKLAVAPLRDIIEATNPEVDISSAEISQEKFFLNNTWAAGYIVPNGEDGDISVVVVRRIDGVWKPVLHNNYTPDSAQKQLPKEVYDYIAGFKDGG